MTKKRIDKSEEYKTCELCKIDCSKEKDTIEDYYWRGNWYIRYDCKHHKIKEQLTRLSSHFCLEHNQFHCKIHRDYCMKIYGKSVMSFHPISQQRYAELAKDQLERIDKETCKLYAWIDQVEFGLIKCAECGKSICECDPEDFEEQEPRLRITIPCEKCSHAIKLKRTRLQILELRTIQCGVCRNRMWFDERDRLMMLDNVSSPGCKSI